MATPTSRLVVAKIITYSLRLDQPIFCLEGDIDWSLLLHHADGHSLTPLLYDTWRTAQVLDQVPSEIQDHLAQAYADNAQRNHYIGKEVLEVNQILTKADIPHLVLKGWLLLEQLYSDPAHRVLYDQDLLVPPDRATSGHQALRAAGFKPLLGKDEWVTKHLQPLWRNEGYEWDGYLFDPHYPRPVELHISLWEQEWRGLRVKALVDPWSDTRYYQVNGVPMLALSPENTLIHLAMHFAGHLIERKARLNQLLDLARYSQHHVVSLQWSQILDRAKQAHISRFVCASLFLAAEIFGSPLPPPKVWQRLLDATPRKFKTWLASQGAIDVLSSDYRQAEKGKDYRLTFLAATSLWERLGIIRFATLPPLAQLQAKYQLKHPGLGVLYYPHHIWERAWRYSRGMWENR